VLVISTMSNVHGTNVKLDLLQIDLGRSGTESGLFSPSASVCTSQYHFTNVPYSLSSNCCSYRKEKRANHGTLSKSNAMARIGERSIENLLHLVFE
jgi:hypothetical protein